MQLFYACTFALGMLPVLVAGVSPAGVLGDGHKVMINDNDIAIAIARTAQIQTKIERGLAAIASTGAGGRPQKRARDESAQTDSSGSYSPGRPVPLTKSDGYWYGNITVGYPLQAFQVVFDTGSADVFLSGPACTGDPCQGHHIYHPEDSTSALDAMRHFSIGLDGSSISGELWLNTVGVNGVPAFNQTIGVADEYSDQFSLANFPADGYLGMGFRTLSNFDTDPVFQTMLEQGAFTEPTFAFNLASSNPELFLGGVNPNLFRPPFTYVPVTTGGFWEVEMDSVQIQDQTIVTSVQAIIDTTTEYIVGDPDSVDAFYQLIPGSAPLQDGWYTVPCDNLPTMSLTFGGTTFTIDPSTFILGQMADVPGCLGALIGVHLNGLWVVGGAFLQNVYTKFDLGQAQVGFAELA